MQFTTIALASLLSTAYALPQVLTRQEPPATKYTVTNLLTVCEGVVPGDCFYTLDLSDTNDNASFGGAFSTSCKGTRGEGFSACEQGQISTQLLDYTLYVQRVFFDREGESRNVSGSVKTTLNGNYTIVEYLSPPPA